MLHWEVFVSLWAVYKSALGDEFGEYTIIMYRYAKNIIEITEIVIKMLPLNMGLCYNRRDVRSWGILCPGLI